MRERFLGLGTVTRLVFAVLHQSTLYVHGDCCQVVPATMVFRKRLLRRSLRDYGLPLARR